MNSSKEHTNPVADHSETLVAGVADDFIERLNRGENPSVDDYARQYPELSGLLRKVLPALRVMSRAKPEIEAPWQRSDPKSDIDGRLGDYRIIREIGRGGMGVVYEAQQISLQRQVALKVLPFAAALDYKRLERFKHEAQAAAQLHHSHIVPVHAVGSERGVYYYAMQLIEGDSLVDVIRELRRLSPSHDQTDGNQLTDVELDLTKTLRLDALSDQDESRLPNENDRREVSCSAETMRQSHFSTAHSANMPDFIRNVAALGIQAAEGLDHAHSHDVVHRDIKPGNLLIDERSHLWITDFGLARFRDEATLTVTGDLIGTLCYMSPEQASARTGVVDHRTDIYSLGVTLYELLTLEPAFSRRDRMELLRQIAVQDPIPPARLNKSIPKDLETIILKAMEKEPDNRYSHARDLADDLRRFLDSRPILAKRPTVLERISKWSRRHKPIVTAGVIVLFIAVLVLGTSLTLIAREKLKTDAAYAQLSIEQTKTKLKQQETEKALQAAKQHFEQAREMLTFFMEVTEEDLAGKPEMQEVRSKLLSASLEYYQDFIEQSRDNQPLQAELAASHLRVARILHEIGSTPAAMVALEQAVKTQEDLVRQNPTDKNLRRNLISIYTTLGVFRGKCMVDLAAQSSVQKHLGLSESQIEQTVHVVDEYHNRIQRNKSWNDPTRSRLRFQEHTETAEIAITEILNLAQEKRLRQIELQRRGTHAFSDPGIAKTLGLSSAQEIEIRSIQREARKTMSECYRKHKRNNARNRIQAFKNRINQLLTSDQQRIWRELIGEPFKHNIQKWGRASKSNRSSKTNR